MSSKYLVYPVGVSRCIAGRVGHRSCGVSCVVSGGVVLIFVDDFEVCEAMICWVVAIFSKFIFFRPWYAVFPRLKGGFVFVDGWRVLPPPIISPLLVGPHSWEVASAEIIVTLMTNHTYVGLFL